MTQLQTKDKISLLSSREFYFTFLNSSNDDVTSYMASTATSTQCEVLLDWFDVDLSLKKFTLLAERLLSFGNEKLISHFANHANSSIISDVFAIEFLTFASIHETSLFLSTRDSKYSDDFAYALIDLESCEKVSESFLAMSAAKSKSKKASIIIAKYLSSKPDPSGTYKLLLDSCVGGEYIKSSWAIGSFLMNNVLHIASRDTCFFMAKYSYFEKASLAFSYRALEKSFLTDSDVIELIEENIYSSLTSLLIGYTSQDNISKLL